MLNNINNSQKGIHYERGVSLVLTFFIMGTTLAIVLGMSAIILSEIKLIRGMGDSVVAFYAADSGIEKTISFDRKSIPDGGTRGLCNICNVCSDCHGCSLNGTDCALQTCTNCTVSYLTYLNGKTYEVEAIVTTNDEVARTVIKSFGSYKETTRAIELSFTGEGGQPLEGPVIINDAVVPRSTPTGIALYISADISDVDGVDTSTTVAYIQNPDEVDIDIVILMLSEGNEYDGTYLGVWTGPNGAYYIDMVACDIEGNCSETENS